jgi:hypothetical protein
MNAMISSDDLLLVPICFEDLNVRSSLGGTSFWFPAWHAPKWNGAEPQLFQLSIIFQHQLQLAVLDG